MTTTSHHGHDLLPGEADERREDEQAVGGRVEQLPEAAHLVEPAGDEAVDEVGDARDHEGEQRRAVVADDEEHEEDRDEQQPDEAEHVRDRQDPATHRRHGHLLLGESSQARGSSEAPDRADRMPHMAPLLLVLIVAAVVVRVLLDLLAHHPRQLLGRPALVDRPGRLRLDLRGGIAGFADVRLDVMAVLVTRGAPA